MKYNLGGCVVFYNPDINVIDNIKTYSSLVEELVIVDNSDKPDDAIINELHSIKNIHVIRLGDNYGIAYALNIGIQYLESKDINICLTMDQDSKFPTEWFDDIWKIITANINQYAILGLNYNAKDDCKQNEIVRTKYWLTSGNFLRLDAYNKTTGFKTGLFIDYVDIEFDHQLIKLGYQIGIIRNYSILHTIGNPITKKVFGRMVTSMNHSPVRYYYRYRNGTYLYKTDKKYYKEKYMKDIFFNIPKMLLWEKNRLQKLKMIKKGIVDAKHSKLGRFA